MVLPALIVLYVLFERRRGRFGARRWRDRRLFGALGSFRARVGALGSLCPLGATVLAHLWRGSWRRLRLWCGRSFVHDPGGETLVFGGHFRDRRGR